MELSIALNMQFVNDGAVPGTWWRRVSCRHSNVGSTTRHLGTNHATLGGVYIRRRRSAKSLSLNSSGVCVFPRKCSSTPWRALVVTSLFVVRF